jgi:sulfur carrier protein ThiS
LIIHVKTVGTIKSLQERTRLEPLEVAQGTSVSQVIEHLNIKDWEVGFILINGNRVLKEAILKDQDELTLVAPLAGG